MEKRPHRPSRRLCTALFTVLIVSALAARAAFPVTGQVPEQALLLRNLGLAQLENEAPDKAEATFRELVRLAPADPLGYANLAVALLRQQKHGEALAAVDEALKKAPGRPDLLAIRGAILQWSGDLEGALETFSKAAEAAPEDLEILYGLYRQAESVGGEAGEAARRRTLDTLARLRPENAVVLLARGKEQIAAGDRAGATGTYLRLKELIWQAPGTAEQVLAMVLDALEAGDLAAARVPALRLENVLKVTPLFRESLRELTLGIQGVPVQRFAEEPPPKHFGSPLPVRFTARALTDTPAAAPALAGGDFDGDGATDLARLASAGDEGARLEIRPAGGEFRARALPAPAGLERLFAADLDNDGLLDLLAWGPERLAFWRGDGRGGFADATAAAGLDKLGATAVAVLDFDIEGDLDLALFGGKAGAGEVLRNNLEGPLQAVGDQVLPGLETGNVRDVVASDLDRDGDLDLLLARERGLNLLDNLRQGRFADRARAAGLAAASGVAVVASADLDNDGRPEIVTAGSGIRAWRNLGGRFEPLAARGLPAGGSFTALLAFDADNDGRLDLAAAGPHGVVILGQRPDGGAGMLFQPLPLEGTPSGATALAAFDADGDGDLDLAASGADGLHLLTNEGGNRNHWLAVRLKGLDKGNSKNNLLGLGSTLEVRAGTAYQFREVTGDVTHFGLGDLRQAYLLRVVWTNGVPQNRIGARGDQRVVEEQVLKGSCPFLYAWNGEEMAFVTDLLWGSPLGLPVAPGVWAGADPSELVRVDGARTDEAGRYRLRVTEELWEAAFFDHLRLWVVDHPADVEVASSLRVLPGRSTPERVLGSRDLKPVAAAWDGRGHDVTARVARRDDVYADGYAPSPYQGVAAAPWTFTFDLGEAPAAPVRLHLDGWIFPADASLNLAVAQRSDLVQSAPRLEVETAGGWEVLVPEMGFPAGKTKTLVVDTPPLPPGARRLRIVTTLWLGWDRLAWTTAPADDAPAIRAQLLPEEAELRFRGFSEPRRPAPNGPHVYAYEARTAESPWLPFAGRYTRYGEVGELLAAADDFSVILAPGDEIALAFDASALPPPPAGWRRAVFLESHGWDKDADRNTYQAHHLEPLPFRAMSGYPYPPGESYPETPEHQRYRREWLTRELPAAP